MYLFSNITRLLTVSVIFIFAQLKTTYGDTIIEYIVMRKLCHINNVCYLNIPQITL